MGEEYFTRLPAKRLTLRKPLKPHVASFSRFVAPIRVKLGANEWGQQWFAVVD
ncbi:hypothetical protein OLX02_07645 [Novosphingobium sp. KCTC 2891]|uniref:hypothetical protein n=1 Tax=Novosphingobium sp. KCTC 2891 TaxID=2989730 RepID=UPI0022216268|nr:hypothetical protein [Novosphingobium sp. KCTC 2891]MCW1382695.1 hypothetical protein [Novosphingobium sp. KCTC 2891]